MTIRGGLFFLVATLIAGGLALGVPRLREAEGPPLQAPAYGKPFWDHWGDGQAELAGYDLTYPRYGELRRGTAVTIFVTETFDNDQRVKSDRPKRLGGGEFPVMKLNLVQDFPTGIYDYNLMTSAFVSLEPVNGRPPGSLTKVSFSSQEWCGHVYAQLLFDELRARYQSHSYFDGEADVDTRIPNPQDGLSEDALHLWARGFAAPALAPGESRDVRLLRSLSRVRLGHKEADWRRATLSREREAVTIEVPAGSFETEVYRVVDHDDDRTWTAWVERAAPRRLIRWSASDGLKAELLASKRMQYWNMNRAGMESALGELGLEPRSARTP